MHTRKEPYEKQREDRAEYRKRLLDVLLHDQLPFNQLMTAAKMTHPTLDSHLNELKGEGIVGSDVREIDGRRRIVFFLTDKGKGQEQFRQDILATAFQNLRTYLWPTDERIAAIGKFAKEKPELFNRIISMTVAYMAFMISDDALAWLNKHGVHGFDILKARVEKLTKDLPNTEVFKSKSEDEQVIFAMQNIFQTIRDVMLGK